MRELVKSLTDEAKPGGVGGKVDESPRICGWDLVRSSGAPEVPSPFVGTRYRHSPDQVIPREEGFCRWVEVGAGHQL